MTSEPANTTERASATQTAILDLMTAEMYRLNPYRLSGLSAVTPESEILATGANPEPVSQAAPLFRSVTDAKAREAAVSSLRDPELRSIYSFFWVWPAPIGGRDRALDAFSRGAWTEAVEIWRYQAAGKSDGVAKHNLAVCFHALALERELSEQPLDAREQRERDLCWAEAFSQWKIVADQPAVWTDFADHLAAVAPTQKATLPPALRDVLLEAVAFINGRLARQARASSAWERQVTLLASSRFPASALARARVHASLPLVKDLRARMTSLTRAVDANPGVGATNALACLALRESHLGRLRAVLGPAEATPSQVEVATAAMHCLLAYGRATNTWSDLNPLAAQCAELAAENPSFDRWLRAFKAGQAEHEARLAAERAEAEAHIAREKAEQAAQRAREEKAQLAEVMSRCDAISRASTSAAQRLDDFEQMASEQWARLDTASEGALLAQVRQIIATAVADVATALADKSSEWVLAYRAVHLARSLGPPQPVEQKLKALAKTLDASLRDTQAAELAKHQGASAALLEAVSPDIYRTNIFRISGLPVTSTDRDLSRYLQRVEHAVQVGMTPAVATGFLSLPALPSVDVIRASAQRVRDPRVRVVDELFWLWTDPPVTVMGTRPLDLTSSETIEAGLARWEESLGTVGTGLATHNRAVLHHCLALDFERRHPGNANPGPDPNRHWTEALKQWRKLTATPAFWELFVRRVEGHGDTRASRDFAREVQASVPAALVAICADLARSSLGRDPGQHARMLWLLESMGTQFGPAALRDGARETIRRIRADQGHICGDRQKDADSEPAKGLFVADALLKQSSERLHLLDVLLKPGDQVRELVHDELARAVATCAREYGNESEDWTEALVRIEQALTIAEGRVAREELSNETAAIRRGMQHERGQTVLNDLSDRIRTIVEGASTAEAKFAALKEQATEPPPTADAALLADESFLEVYTAVTASGLRRVALTAHNDEDKPDLAIDILAFAATICRDAELREKIAADLNTMRRMASERRLVEQVSKRCRDISESRQANAQKLEALIAFIKGDLPGILDWCRGHDAELPSLVTNIVASAVRSTAIDLHNNDHQFALSVTGIQWALHVARDPEMRGRLQQDLASAQATVQRVGPSAPVPQPKQTSSSNCFVATAVYGDARAAQVLALRRFRDAVILKQPWGNAAVEAYYALSPPVARFLRSHPRWRRLARAVLDPIADACDRHALEPEEQP